MNAKSSIMTAAGPIASDAIGATLMHEHIFTMNAEHYAEHPETFNEEAELEHAVELLDRLSDLGFSTLVDCTVLGLGRNVYRIAKLARRTKINIVVSTGVYAMHEVPRYFALRGPGTLLGGDDPITAMMIEDIVNGVGDSGVRAGMIKMVVESDNPATQRIARAVADAHQQTGAPITVHTNGTADAGRIAVRMLLEGGVDLTRVVLGHAGESDDLDYLKWACDLGAFVGFDRIGADVVRKYEDYTSTLKHMLTAGYATQVVVSHDAACSMQHFRDDYGRRAYEKLTPHWNYELIPTRVIPELRAAGHGDDTIRTIFVDNPNRILCGGAVVGPETNGG
ncbi:hypothetical protein AU252_00865 [Pseudarthrobacter sulfonivorans]|uniref:Phosphotriesterase n=1 Tax=Pseudarthrobacter sulfonivorans TaxID=121292 RepID=A0A0U2X7A3_9MICC|nr:phosphotriesterase [Pseudarthrobacter sulfonivorans]ALV39890.1 hypothetical protein AU252_00865 [Pseudarthrobacter sulfonivorans]